MTKIESVQAQFGQSIDGPTDFDDPKVRRKSYSLIYCELLFSAI